MNKFFLYSQVIAPPPPQWLISQSQEIVKGGIKPDADRLNYEKTYTNRELLRDGKSYNNAYTQTFTLDARCLDWCKQNISPNSKDIRYACTPPGLEFNGPHTDRTRKYTLLFLLESGGPYHKTVWYKETGVNKILHNPGYNINDYTKVDTIAEYQIPLNTWTILNAQVLHGVININQGRSAIQVSLDVLPEDTRLLNTVFYQT